MFIFTTKLIFTKINNKMKKITSYLMIMILTLSTLSTQKMVAKENPIAVTNSPKEVPADVKVMLNRLDEIKAMDKSQLNASEKKALRKEVRAIHSTLRSTNNGVYLSVGAIIIIILLLILLL